MKKILSILLVMLMAFSSFSVETEAKSTASTTNGMVKSTYDPVPTSVFVTDKASCNIIAIQVPCKSWKTYYTVHVHVRDQNYTEFTTANMQRFDIEIFYGQKGQLPQGVYVVNNHDGYIDLVVDSTAIPQDYTVTALVTDLKTGITLTQTFI